MVLLPLYCSRSGFYMSGKIEFRKEMGQKKKIRKRGIQKIDKSRPKASHLIKFSICMIWRREETGSKWVRVSLIFCNHPRISLFGDNTNTERMCHGGDITRWYSQRSSSSSTTGLWGQDSNKHSNTNWTLQPFVSNGSCTYEPTSQSCP